MSDRRNIYWDSSCFICFLNKDETDRRLICEDVLRHAQLGELTIWTSTWTIVEVIRPKKKAPVIPALPSWAIKAIAASPESKVQLERMWELHHKVNAPWEKLTPDQISKIQGMFEWEFLELIWLDERTANKAVELARDFGLKPADSIHAASAILNKKMDALQRWDRDFNKIAHLITVEEPQPLSQQKALIEDFRRAIGPTPEEFEKKPRALGSGDPKPEAKKDIGNN
jgi:predicted nucleic acid-binding protein